MTIHPALQALPGHLLYLTGKGTIAEPPQQMGSRLLGGQTRLLVGKAKRSSSDLPDQQPQNQPADPQERASSSARFLAATMAA